MKESELNKIKKKYEIVGNCDGMNRAIEMAVKIAPVDISVLVYGENGSGKEIFSHIIHDNSRRSRKKLMSINCGAIPEGTIDSELFGHKKGAYTDALEDTKGYFGSTDGGTLFLDEIGELPLGTQSRLLRVLETGEYLPVGATKVEKTDVRIVAATNVDLLEAVRKGKFREDLYYRLNTIPIQMPALRDRGEDIILLFRLFAMQMAEKYHLPRITLTDEARQLMLSYKWPGNVRQLKNITEQISVLSEKREIDAEALSHFIPRDPESMQLAVVGEKGDHSYETERELLYKILYELRGNVTDLRRDMNSLRKQLDEARGLSGAAGFQNPIQAVDVKGIQPAINTHISSSAPQLVEAEAEEISEPESLNLNDMGRQLLEKALDRNGGNRKKAAQELGISDRTLYRRLKQFGLDK